MQTDVLIIGAGGAGLRAAIAAKHQGAAPLVVSKGEFPGSCNTAMAGGVMLAPLNGMDNPDQYARDTIKAGGGLNYPSLVAAMAKDASQRALDLQSYGLSYLKDKDGIRLWPTADSKLPRALPGGVPYSGDWFKALVNEVKKLNIQVIEHFTVMDLLKKGAAVAGAAGFDNQTGEFAAIAAKSIVLATGGAGQIYSFSSNVPGITGDGIVMAYKAGAALSHLEFMQMRQCIIHPKGLAGMLPPFDGFVSTGGRFYNGNHDRYMKYYHPDKAEVVTRAEISKCAQLEIMNGRQSPNGGVYGDLSDVPADELKKVKRFMDACYRINFDPGVQSYEWAPAAHHFMGGVVINPACETGVPGLFAAGEAAAGVQGANRMGGNALTETQVFGALAGKNAAQYPGRTLDEASIKKLSRPIRERVDRILGKDKGRDHEAVRSQITGLMSRYVGVVRNGDDLAKAEDRLGEIASDQVSELCLSGDTSFSAVTHLLEVENILVLSRLVARAAKLRAESRGAHQRLDYPESDTGWDKHLVFRLTEKGTVVEEKKQDRVHTS